MLSYGQYALVDFTDDNASVEASRLKHWWDLSQDGNDGDDSARSIEH